MVYVYIINFYKQIQQCCKRYVIIQWIITIYMNYYNNTHINLFLFFTFCFAIGVIKIIISYHIHSFN